MLVSEWAFRAMLQVVDSGVLLKQLVFAFEDDNEQNPTIGI
jgi:hypothetical protein